MDQPSIEDRFEALEAEVRTLRAELAARPDTAGAAPTAPAAPPDHRTTFGDAPTSRRRLLTGAAAGAAAVVVGSVATASPAAAAVGTMQYGTSNDAGSLPTTLETSDEGHTLSLINTGAGTALTLQALTSGLSISAGSGPAITGYSQNNLGAFIQAPNNRGAWILSKDAQLYLEPQGTRQAPTLDSQAHQRGEVLIDSAGILWLCVTNGTPGTWRRLGGPTSAGAFHVLPAPVRVYDSRSGTSPSQGPKTPLTGNIARPIDLKVNSSGVPAGATAVLLTVLLVNAANASGNMTIWANGATRPSANTMVWGGSAGRFTSSAVTAIDSQARCQVSASASTNLVLDVVGYYR